MRFICWLDQESKFVVALGGKLAMVVVIGYGSQKSLECGVVPRKSNPRSIGAACVGRWIQRVNSLITLTLESTVISSCD